MQRHLHVSRSPDTTIASANRSRAFWSGVAAVLLCYFGFWQYSAGITTAGWVFFYTLRLGGVAMAVTTLLLLSGWKTARAIDGIASMLIGGGLFASGLLMISGNTTQGLLYLVFGYMFASSGWSSYSEWRWIAGRSGSDTGYDPGFQSRYEQTMAQPPGDSLASQLLDRSRNPQPEPETPSPPDASRPDEDPIDMADTADQPEPESTFEIEESKDPPPPPPRSQDTSDGFLASFADPNPENDKT